MGLVSHFVPWEELPYFAQRRQRRERERETNCPQIGSHCQRERQCKSVCVQVAQRWCLLLITLNSHLGLLPYLMYLQSYYIFLKTFFLPKNFMLVVRVHDGAEPEFAVLIFSKKHTF